MDTEMLSSGLPCTATMSARFRPPDGAMSRSGRAGSRRSDVPAHDRLHRRHAVANHQAISLRSWCRGAWTPARRAERDLHAAIERQLDCCAFAARWRAPGERWGAGRRRRFASDST